MSVAVVGGGYWGKNLIRDFNKLKALNTICEASSKLQDEYSVQYPNVRITGDYDSVLEDKNIKQVVISLPAELHYEFAKKSLLVGKHTYVEKPLTLDLNEAQELIELSKSNNCVLMVGHLLQYHPAVEKIYEMVDSGKIGKIRYINSNRLNLGKFRQEENVLWSFAPHDISVILRLLNDQLPEYVISHGHSYLTKDIHDVTSTMMGFKDGTYCQINVNWLNPYKEQKMIIVGTEGMIIFNDCVENKIIYYPEYYSWKMGKPLPIKSEGEIIEFNVNVNPLVNECQHFLNCCADRKIKPRTDGREGLRVLKVLQASENSLRTGGEKYYINDLADNEKSGSMELDYYVHSSSLVEKSTKIGAGSKVWHFSHLMNCEVGKNCNVGQNVFIGNNVKLGDNCKIQNNVSIYDGVIAGNDVFFGPSCVLTNDLTPRAKFSKSGKYVATIIEDQVSIGANATIVCGVKLGEGCMIGAGAVVTKDVAPWTVVIGNPAKFHKKVSPEGELL